MDEKDIHKFSSDRPILNIEDDLLGRADFSKDLASALLSWQGKDSLVVALHGDWGSGKSSIKNMAISELQKNESCQPEIIEFSPWEWAAQEKITASFFQEISSIIGRKDKSSDGKKLAATLKKYGRYLNTGESLVTGFSASLPTLFILAALFGAGSHFSDTTWVQNITTALLCITVSWAAALKWGRLFLNKLSGNAEATAKDNQHSLSELRNDLTNLLAKRSNSLLVIMDDLDRLTSAQLRMVFQLVKANTEFPNVVFLLLFQRDLVEEKLTDGKQTGRDYLEKIIQVPFDIPKIEQTRLQNLLFSNLDKIIEQDATAVEMFNSGYWWNIFHSSIFSYFDNLRNVYRFTSTFSFHFSLLRGRSTFEVNPVDLIAIECLRLFEPDIYREISRSKNVFTEIRSGSHTGTQDNTTPLITEIIAKSSAGKEAYVKKLLLHLFPNIEWALGGTHYSSSFANTWLMEMRICHPSNFDKYFQFSIPSGELSNSDLQEMLELTSDTAGFTNLVNSLKDRGILKNALSQFEAFIDQIPLENTKPFILSLLNLGDKVDHETIGFSMFSSNTHLVRLTIWLLRRNDNLEQRGEILLECFKESSGLSIIEHILQGDENRREKSQDDIILADKEFEELKLEFIKKINYLADNDPIKLMSNEHFGSFLYRWKRWGNESKVRSWVSKIIIEPSNCLIFLRSFVLKSSSQGMDDYVAKINKYLKLEHLENFVTITEIQETLDKVKITEIDDQDKEALEEFNKAINRRENGEVDEW